MNSIFFRKKHKIDVIKKIMILFYLFILILSN